MTISVVIPTHNRSKLLKRAVESVLNQTIDDVEIIVVSDGSTDDTEIMISELQKQYMNLKYIYVNPSKGANNARNTGVNESTGEFIAFLDDDDEWTPDKLESQLKVFQSDPEIGLVYTGINVIFVDFGKTYYNYADLNGDLSKQILLKNYIGATPSVMVRKNILNKAGLFDLDMPAKQDYDLWIRLCQLTKVGSVPGPKVNYYNYSSGEQISSNTTKHEEALRIINKKYEGLFNELTKSERKLQKHYQNISIANVALRNNHKLLSLKYTLFSFIAKPNFKSIIYLGLIPFNYKTILSLRDKSIK